MTSPLLKPLSFHRGAIARNRVWLAPMTNQQSQADGSLGEAELLWLEARAAGGFGVVETCAAYVTQDGKAWPGELGIHDDAMIPGLTRLASMLRGHGALGIVQLFHGGARAVSAVSGTQPVSATAFVEERPGFEPPRAATEADLSRYVAAFAEAARRAADAGFDGVELHGAHGYLLSQFLSTTYNTRTDAWGGDITSRARLLLDVLTAVRAAVPASFLVGARISPEDFGQAKGLHLQESLQVAAWLAERGLDFLHLSLWDAARNTSARPDRHAIELFREAVGPGLPLVVAGGIWTAAEAEALLARGADAVALGRSGIANPAWPREVAGEAHEPKRPPLSPTELEARALSPAFVTYMRNWKGFVTEA